MIRRSGYRFSGKIMRKCKTAGYEDFGLTEFRTRPGMEV